MCTRTHVDLNLGARANTETHVCCRVRCPRAASSAADHVPLQPATAAAVVFVTAFDLVEQSEHFTSDLRDGRCTTRCG